MKNINDSEFLPSPPPYPLFAQFQKRKKKKINRSLEMLLEFSLHRGVQLRNCSQILLKQKESTSAHTYCRCARG